MDSSWLDSVSNFFKNIAVIITTTALITGSIFKLIYDKYIGGPLKDIGVNLTGLNERLTSKDTDNQNKIIQLDKRISDINEKQIASDRELTEQKHQRDLDRKDAEFMNEKLNEISADTKLNQEMMSDLQLSVNSIVTAMNITPPKPKRKIQG